MADIAKWTHRDMVSMDGKVCLVTGANSGLGLEIAKRLAEHGGEVIMACRTPSKGESAKEEVLAEIGSDKKMEVMQLDVSSLESVSKFADEFLAKYTKLDVLMCNAGVMALDPRQTSVDGFEMQLATNHLGHFLLVGKLLDLLKKTPGSRVVTQSSSGNWQGSFNWDDMNAEKEYIRYDQYAMTKLCNVVFVMGLQKRLTAAGLTSPTAYVSHPGLVIGQLQSNATASLWESIAYKVTEGFAGTYETGSQPAEYAATSPYAEPAKLYGPSGFYRGIFGGAYPRVVFHNKLADDEETVDKLWQVSEQMTKCIYKF